MDYTDSKTVNIIFSMPTTPLYPSLSLLPSLTLTPGDNALPLPDHFASLDTLKLSGMISTFAHTDLQVAYEQIKLVDLILTLNETDASSFTDSRLVNIVSIPSELDNVIYYQLNKEITIVSNVSKFEAMYMNGIFIYVIPMANMTVISTDYQAMYEQKIISLVKGMFPSLTLFPSIILFPTGTSFMYVRDYLSAYNQHIIDSILNIIKNENVALTESNIIDMLFTIPEADNTVQFQINKNINGIFTPSVEDIVIFPEGIKTIDIISSVGGFTIVPYDHFYFITNINKPKINVINIGKPKIEVTYKGKPKLLIRSL